MKQSNDDSSYLNTLASLTAALAIGFGLGLLLAPKSGRKLRADLGRTADRLLDGVDDLRSSAADLFEKGKQNADTVLDTVENAKKAYRRVVG
jgi:gas vesicle protein